MNKLFNTIIVSIIGLIINRISTSLIVRIFLKKEERKEVVNPLSTFIKIAIAHALTEHNNKPSRTSIQKRMDNKRKGNKEDTQSHIAINWEPTPGLISDKNNL